MLVSIVLRMEFKVFDSHAKDVYENSDPEGTRVLLEIPSLDKLVQYFQSLYRNDEIYELKGMRIDKLEVNSSSGNLLEDCSVSKINNYARSCKRCYVLGFYAMCYSVINPCGYWTPSTLGILVDNGR